MSDAKSLNHSSSDFLQLHSADNVGMAIRPLPGGETVQIGDRTIDLATPIKMGHKIALESIATGKPIRKYGEVIGFASAAITPGEWVHSHNLQNGEPDNACEKATAIPPQPAPLPGKSFAGYRRSDGRVGTRNYVAVISTVNCSATVCREVARKFTPARLEPYENIDGVVAFTHETGCGMPFRGESHRMLNRVLAGIANHPNIGAYVVIGLGCEQNTLGVLVGDHRLTQRGHGGEQGQRPPLLTIQDQGGTKATIEAAEREIERLLPQVDTARRTTVPASEIILATECGGSDAYSGITANPVVGAAADRLVACGGTAILAETTEVYGAEHLLTRRARTADIADRLLDRIQWWKWYAGLFGAELDNNPSPGNKEGGLTTIAEKSLGAIAKGGTTALEAVYEYAEPVTQAGFVFMDTPGYDPPSVTGMVAGGANLVVFTTGRGSCFGCKPTPSIKVATNTPMFERMESDMDLNAGSVLHGRTVDEVGQELFDMLLDVASGRQTKSEQHGVGDNEFVPWTIGPTL